MRHEVMQRLLNPLRPPTFPDVERTDMAWMLHWLLIVVTLANIVAQVLATWALPTYFDRGVRLVVLYTIPMLILFVLNHRGHPVAAARLLNIFTWLFLSLAALSAGGLEAPAIMSQFVIVSTAGALLGWRWGLVATAVCIATVTGIGLTEYLGLLPEPEVVHTSISRLPFLIMYLAILGFEWMLILTALGRARARAEAEVIERQRAEAEVREANRELEQRVATRTAELEAAVTELRMANERLDEALRAKSDFIASVSHELRTPLNAIIGFSRLLSEQLTGPLSTDQVHQATLIHEAGQRLLRLVDQVLNISRIENHEDLGQSRFDPVVVANRMLELIEPLAASKDLSVRVEGPEQLSALHTNEAAVEQVLLNLLSNAVKYTDRGVITLAMSAQGSSFVYTVRDTGPGITPENQERIFQRFVQGRPANGGKFEGAGLGLSLARDLARALGGDVVLDSTGETGSSFSFIVPLSRS